MCLQSMPGLGGRAGTTLALVAGRPHAVSGRRLVRGGATSQRSSASTSLRSGVMPSTLAVPAIGRNRRLERRPASYPRRNGTGAKCWGDLTCPATGKETEELCCFVVPASADLEHEHDEPTILPDPTRSPAS